MRAGAVVGDFIHEGKSRLGFRKNELCGDLAFFDIADDCFDLEGMNDVTEKREVELGRGKDIDGNDCSRSQFEILIGLELNHKRAVLKPVSLCFCQFPAKLDSKPALEVERLDFRMAEKRRHVGVVGDGDFCCAS